MTFTAECINCRMALPSQLPQLTFTRFVAAFFVVAYHFGQQAWPLTTFPLNQWAMEGGLGVSFFFVLSGFVLMWVYAPQGEGRPGKAYWMARVARILPLYWASFVASLLIVMFLRDEYPRGLSIILQALGLHAWVPGYSISINFPGWTVSVELFFYLCFPFLLPSMRRMRLGWLLGVVGVLYAAVQVLYINWEDCMPVLPNDPSGDFKLRFPLWHLPSFLVGILAARLTRMYYADWKGGPGVLMALVGGGALVLIISTQNVLRTYSADGLLAPLFALLVMGLALLPDRPARVLGHPALVLLGEVSYAFYLLQCPVYMIWEYVYGRGGVTGNLFWWYVVSLLVASLLCHYGLERPARNWLRRR